MDFSITTQNITGSVATSPGLIFYIIAYCIGSIPFGLILTKTFMKQDLRSIGSGNIGTTNVLRTGNKYLAAFTLLLDGSKGAIMVIIAFSFTKSLSPTYTLDNYQLYGIPLLFGLFAILGHCFPIWLKFKGGKGVATALGALLAAVPYAGLAACATWLITAKITKISSLSALVAVAVATVVTLILYGTAPAMICALITLLVWIRHKDNIKRLLKGEEPKIGSGKKKDEPVSKQD